MQWTATRETYRAGNPRDTGSGPGPHYDRWMEPPDTAAAVARARRYPFAQPSGSYLFRRSGCEPLPRDGIPAGDGELPPGFAGRTPTLAYASNASPDALARKFGSLPDVSIPVTACALEDFEAVYSRHFYRGCIPATLAPMPGTTLLTWVTWLDPAQMELMNGTEHLGVNYELKPLADGLARLETGWEIRDPFAYHGLHGRLRTEGRMIAVKGTSADGRQLNELDQNGILELVRRRIAPGLTVAEMVSAAIGSPEEEARLTAAVKRISPD